MHVAKLLTKKLEGNLALNQSQDKALEFSIQVGYRLDYTKQAQLHTTSTDDKVIYGTSSMIELSQLLIVTNNVIDRLALKFTLSREMQLGHCTDFIFSMSDILNQFK